MSQPTIRTEIRLQLLRAEDRLRAATDEVANAIEALDRGDTWDQHAGSARLEMNIASEQLQTARGMAMVASLPIGSHLR